MSRKTTHSHFIEAQARAMRFEQTPTEEALWRELRGGKLDAVVRRQYVVGRYIADFAVPARRLVIEVDGAYHAARRVADARRDRELAAGGACCGCRRFASVATLIASGFPYFPRWHAPG